MISHTTVFQRLQARLPLHRREWSSDLDAVSRPQAAVLVALSDSPQPEVLLHSISHRDLTVPHLLKFQDPSIGGHQIPPDHT